jgi:hypothetical protein
MATNDTPDPAIGEWYWDKRNKKAYAPVRFEDDTVHLLTVWHRDELDDALDGEAVVPIEEIGLDRVDTTFDLLDSFRFPDESTLESYTADE